MRFLHPFVDLIMHPSSNIDASGRQGLSVELCSNLREVFLGVPRLPGPMLESFLDSITSPKFVKITFEFVWGEFFGGDISTIADYEAWRGVDESLCALMGRLPNRSGSDPLSVVLSVRTVAGTKLESVSMGAFLEQFREKGRVSMAPFKGFLQPVCQFSTSENVP